MNTHLIRRGTSSITVRFYGSGEPFIIIPDDDELNPQFTEFLESIQC